MNRPGTSKSDRALYLALCTTAMVAWPLTIGLFVIAIVLSSEMFGGLGGLTLLVSMSTTSVAGVWRVVGPPAPTVIKPESLEYEEFQLFQELLAKMGGPEQIRALMAKQPDDIDQALEGEIHNPEDNWRFPH